MIDPDNLTTSPPCKNCGKTRHLRKGLSLDYCSFECSMLHRYPHKTAADFWARVDTSDPVGCWRWTGAINWRTGYGAVRWLAKVVSAHRLAYQLTIGAIPPGLLVMHTCDERECCNPAHLRLGTYANNHADMVAKERRFRMANAPGFEPRQS